MTRETRSTSQGKCLLCKGTFSKAAMTRHLESCRQTHPLSNQAPGREPLRSAKVLHLVVEGRDSPDYWMHLEVPGAASLKQLDSFLRQTWLECCGHLSAFTIEGTRYASDPDKEYDERSMRSRLYSVLNVGTKFTHEYDYGTTTRLALRVVRETEGEVAGSAVRLLARNDPPLRTCEACGKTPTQVCSQCIYEGEGWLCDDCASGHECGEEMLLPAVNSPRVGMCGYVG